MPKHPNKQVCELWWVEIGYPKGSRCGARVNVVKWVIVIVVVVVVVELVLYTLLL